MAEVGEHPPQHRRRNPDPVALAVAVVCLCVAIPAMIGDSDWPPDDAVRWFVVAAAVLAGLAVIGRALQKGR